MRFTAIATLAALLAINTQAVTVKVATETTELGRAGDTNETHLTGDKQAEAESDHQHEIAMERGAEYCF